VPCLFTHVQALYSRSKLEFNGLVAAGNHRNRMTAIWTLLLRLRQTCDHPFLVLGRPESRRTPEEEGGDEGDDGSVHEAESKAEDGAPVVGEEMDANLQAVLSATQDDQAAAAAGGLDAASIRRLYVQHVLPLVVLLCVVSLLLLVVLWVLIPCG